MRENEREREPERGYKGGERPKEKLNSLYGLGTTHRTREASLGGFDSAPMPGLGFR